MTIITLDLSSTSMTNNGGIFSERLINFVGKRVKIISIISIVATQVGVAGYLLYLQSNLIQNNSHDSLTNGTSNILQMMDINAVAFAGPTSVFFTESNFYQIETVIPETITITKTSGFQRVHLNDGNAFHVRICMQTLDD